MKHCGSFRTALAVSVSLMCGSVVADHGSSPTQLRRFIGAQVGGIDKLTVPAKDEDLPQPRLTNGSPDPFFQTTEEKRYLGKQLFHDPARMVRIRPEFGGLVSTAGTASCTTCHLGETASKAGTVINFAVGGEGRHYTDAEGNFIARRRANVAILPRLRQTPLFPGDALVDELPTLTDVYEFAIAGPFRGRKLPDPGRLLATGRLDAVDSVGRNAPGVIGAAFNNRLLLDGIAGEPDDSPGGLNPFGHPAQENIALLLMDAHRLLADDPTRPDQTTVLRQIAGYRKLYRDAFPEEAAQAPGCVPETPPAAGACDALINNMTTFRATATFLRTTVTRNTAWDRFLAGHNGALTTAQRRGARLFFTSAKNGGAGCYGCHSGPMLNKQVNDPDVAGVGEFVEQNFYNLGIGDHPIQALNRAVRNDPTFRDRGRQEITGRAGKGELENDAFKFRVLTLRQLKDARFFFHNGSFSSVKDVVKYFNAGVPQDAVAGAAETLTKRFTHPRGDGTPRGLGLSEEQVNDLTDFLENALHDPAFVHFDPKWPKTFFQLSPIDFTYSKYRPDLAALGAVDGRPLSGAPQDNDDALSRRDMGLEFLDVTGRVQIQRISSNTSRSGRRQQDVYRITNNTAGPVDTHLLMIAQGLSGRIIMENGSGVTSTHVPYRRVFLTDGVLQPGQSIVEKLEFRRRGDAPPVRYTLKLLSGQGNP